MHIDRFKKDDGYYDEDDCYYEDAATFIQGKLLDFCCCGDPCSNLEYVRDSLLFLKKKSDHNRTEERFDSEFYKQWNEEVLKYFGNINAANFMWYWLDNKQFSEHGSAIPGWLTDEGEELLEDLIVLTK
jgi:hypothetical protein